MKRHEAMSVGDIIKQAIALTGNSDEYDRQRASFLWPEVVGPAINRHTTRRWVEQDVMYVCITSASLKHELSFHVDALVAKINEAVGRKVLSKIVIH